MTALLEGALVRLAAAATAWLERRMHPADTHDPPPIDEAAGLWTAVHKQSNRSKGLLQRVKVLEENRLPAGLREEVRLLQQEVAKLRRFVYRDDETRAAEDAAGLAVLLANYQALTQEFDAFKRGNAALYPQELRDYVDREVGTLHELVGDLQSRDWFSEDFAHLGGPVEVLRHLLRASAAHGDEQARLRQRVEAMAKNAEPAKREALAAEPEAGR
jgi:hypothetical protein